MAWSYTIDHLTVALEAQRPGDATRFHAVSTDSRTVGEGEVFFALKGERFDGHDFVKQAFDRGAAAAVVSEAISGGVSIVVPDPLEALQRFAAWHRARYEIPMIAITGSCGKTSSKDMIAEVLATRFNVMKTKGNLNNEIGGPLSLLQIDGDTEVAVMEMGANHGGEIARLCTLAKPTEAAITCIAEAHLEGFGGSIDDVARAKGELVAALPDDGVYYVNADDPRCCRIAEKFAGTKVYYGNTGADLRLEDCRFDDDGQMLLRVDPVGELRLPLHVRAHAHNAVLAIAVGLRHGITEFEAPLRKAAQNAARFKVFEVGPLRVLDDSYNANPASMRAALDALADQPGSGRRFAALGDMLEMGGGSARFHRELGAYAAEQGIDRLFAYGEFAENMAEGARAAGLAEAAAYPDHEAIAAAIVEYAQPGDVLLVKGSRGRTMEKVIEHLRRRLEPAATT